MDEYVWGHADELVPLLAAFDAAAEEGHITRAAHDLGIPQSTLSRRIRAVENVLGVALFQPVGRGVALTPQGREFHERTRGVLRALEDAAAAVRSNADPDSGLVRFGFPLTLGPVSIPALLADFHRSAPRVRLHLVQAHGEDLVDRIRAGNLDLAVVIPAPEDLPTTRLGHQEIRAVVPRGHRLAGRRRVALGDLAGEPFVANPPTYHLRRQLDSWCAEAGFSPRVVFEITEFETLRSLVAHGLGVALLPDAETEHTDLVSIRLDGKRRRTIGLVTGGHRPTPAVDRLRRHLEERFATTGGW
ncbi:LysR family transcriptional regulator [Prescottella sp. R16]|uniref:LysR family transcriptional regulator n=1 Tax=Prescottella sp. R16 TaxID=3064529 RepID=UPI00272E40D9|nr:LysR family transcriptional regulator [Prescottella sp. R16]